MTPSTRYAPEHARGRWSIRRPPWTKPVLVLLFILFFLASSVGMAYANANMRVNASGMGLPGGEAIPSDFKVGQPVNMLIIGQDTRDGEGNQRIGGVQDDEHQADTLMVLHVSADRKTLDLVSIPRDSIVDRPACRTSKGMMTADGPVMMNSVFADGWSYGGDMESAVSCTLATVSSVTGMDLHDFVVVDFAGMVRIVDALGGVDLCVPSAVDDDTTGLHLKPGMRRMNGTEATQYARVRHGVEGADGGDVMRTVRQQWLVKAVLRNMLSGGVFDDTSKLYSVGMIALDSLRMSDDLADIHSLVGLAYSMRNLKSSGIHMQTAPTAPYPYDDNRLVLADTEIWSNMMADRPLDEHVGTGQGGQLASSDSPSSDNGHETNTVDPDTGYVRDSSGAVIGIDESMVYARNCRTAAR